MLILQLLPPPLGLPLLLPLPPSASLLLPPLLQVLCNRQHKRCICTHLAVWSAVCLLTDPPVLGQSRCTNSVLLLTPMSPGSATKFCCSRRRWTAWPVLTRPLLTTTTAACSLAAMWTRRLSIQHSLTSTTMTAVRMDSLRLLLSFRTSPSVSYEIRWYWQHATTRADV